LLLSTLVAQLVEFGELLLEFLFSAPGLAISLMVVAILLADLGGLLGRLEFALGRGQSLFLCADRLLRLVDLVFDVGDSLLRRLQFLFASLFCVEVGL
jgi:hypothetical protein